LSRICFMGGVSNAELLHSRTFWQDPSAEAALPVVLISR
jgi:hypothetical protein